ncbi:YidC/Oxa1 family membrane protein insertase [Cohnella thailandensis]|nr:YidC/Oxa1 family membrane protein insertase [Cohnella thailandensis]
MFLLRNRKWWFLLSALSALVLLSGCTPNTAQKTTEELQNSSGWWDSNVVYWFSLMLDKFAEWFGGEYGLSILVLTVIVRTLILPLSIKQFRNSKAMQKLQPEMMKIREKYKDNPQQQQQEMMKLYQEHQVNPLAGCLPLIVQMPIFIALYRAITVNVEISTHQFLWLELGEKDPYYILPIIAACTTFIQSYMMMTMNPQQQMGPMKALMFIFPIMIFIMALSFPSALPLYWIYTNIYTIIQNYFMYGRSPKPEGTGKEAMPNEKTGGNRKNSGSGGKKRSKSARR